MSAKRDLDWTRGDDYAHVISFTDGTDPLDLTDYAFAAQVRSSPASIDAVATFTVDLEELDGTVTISLTRAVTAVMLGSYWWDLQQTDPDAKVTTVLSGNVKVKADVTR